MIYSEYNDPQSVINMDLDEFSELLMALVKRKAKEREDKVVELTLHKWGYELPFMEKPKNFNEYLKDAGLSTASKNSEEGEAEVKGKKIDKQSLIEEIERVRKIDQRQKQGGENK